MFGSDYRTPRGTPSPAAPPSSCSRAAAWRSPSRRRACVPRPVPRSRRSRLPRPTPTTRAQQTAIALASALGRRSSVRTRADGAVRSDRGRLAVDRPRGQDRPQRHEPRPAERRARLRARGSARQAGPLLALLLPPDASPWWRPRPSRRPFEFEARSSRAGPPRLRGALGSGAARACNRHHCLIGYAVTGYPVMEVPAMTPSSRPSAHAASARRSPYRQPAPHPLNARLRAGALDRALMAGADPAASDSSPPAPRT